MQFYVVAQDKQTQKFAHAKCEGKVEDFAFMDAAYIQGAVQDRTAGLNAIDKATKLTGTKAILLLTHIADRFANNGTWLVNWHIQPVIEWAKGTGQ